MSVGELRVRRLRPDARLPARAHPDDAGLDLRCVDAVVLGPGERAAVGTGIAVAIPPGHAGLVVPRSGLALHHGLGLANAPGTIDPGYRGEVRVLLHNADAARVFRAEAGERIGQLLVVPVALPDVAEVGMLDETERGGGGFGSTGR